MTVRAEIWHEPGLHELAARPAPIEDAQMAEAVEMFKETSGVAHTEIASGLDQVIEAHRDVAEESSALGRWWSAVREWLAAEKHEVVATEQRLIELEAYWLTRPAVRNASVKLDVSTTSSSETAASLAIAGIGGGPTINIDVKDGLTHTAMVNERVALRAEAEFQKIVVTKNKKTIGKYPLLAAVDQDNLEWLFVPARVPAASRLGARIRTETFDQSSSPGSTVRKHEVRRGTAWETGFDLSLKQLGLAAKLSAKVTYERDVAFEYSLPPKRRYVAASYDNFPSHIWTVDSR